jgi:urea-proton symporter
MIAAVICWLVTCAMTEGSISVDNLGADYPMLAGNVAALTVSLIVTTIMSYIYPQNFDWDIMRNGIEMIEDDGTDKLAEEGADSAEGLEKALTYATGTALCSSTVGGLNCRTVCVAYRASGKFATAHCARHDTCCCRHTTRYGTALALLLVVVWPALSLPVGVFSKGYFVFWTIIAIVWGLLSSAAMIFLPVWESKDGILTVLKNMIAGKKTVYPEADAPKV